MKSVTSFSVLLFDMGDARKMFKLSWSLPYRIWHTIKKPYEAIQQPCVN